MRVKAAPACLLPKKLSTERRDRSELTRSYQKPKILATGLQFHRWSWTSCSVWFTVTLRERGAHKHAATRRPAHPAPERSSYWFRGLARPWTTHTFFFFFHQRAVSVSAWNKWVWITGNKPVKICSKGLWIRNN